jgi:hypothetical protein
MAKILGSIDPELLEKFGQAVPDALTGAAKAEQAEPSGFGESGRYFAVETCVAASW